MRNRLLFQTWLAVVFLVNQKPAAALVPVTCANCSQEVTSLLGYARQAEQLANEVNQLKTEVAQYANMVANTISLPQQIWSDVSNTVSQVRNLANQASLLAGGSGTIQSRLNAAQNLAYQAAATPEGAYAQYTQGRQAVGNSAAALGRVLGLQQSQQIRYATLQEQMQLHSQTADGQKQAIQAGNEMLALSNTQLQQIQTTLTAQAQVMATKAESDADRQALSDYAKHQFFAKIPITMTGNSYP